jgi:UDP-N-acetylglucosamine 2-epimerase
MRVKEIVRNAPRIASIVGTRPEAIKMAPVVRALASKSRFRHQLVLTGQHGGLETLFPDVPHVQLPCDPRGLSAMRLREAIHSLLCVHFGADPPDLVLVHGDTTSALAGAMAARGRSIPIGHVEAGLRSFDLGHPWPEEGNRMVVDALSSLLFAPTAAAAANLDRDWRVKGMVYVTGNSGIDALVGAAASLPPPERTEARTLLVTCHRTENRGAAMRRLCSALRTLVRVHGLEIAFPLHPNRHLRAEVEALLGGEPKIRLLDPLEHREMVRLMTGCWAILTDSGGLQEEGPALGKPVLVLRDVTERGEALETENVELVGTQEEAIVAAVTRLTADSGRYARMSRPALPFGDGRAAPRIVAAIEDWLAQARLRAA